MSQRYFGCKQIGHYQCEYAKSWHAPSENMLCKFRTKTKRKIAITCLRMFGEFNQRERKIKHDFVVVFDHRFAPIQTGLQK